MDWLSFGLGLIVGLSITVLVLFVQLKIKAKQFSDEVSNHEKQSIHDSSK